MQKSIKIINYFTMTLLMGSFVVIFFLTTTSSDFRGYRTTTNRIVCEPNKPCITKTFQNREITLILRPTYLPILTPLEIEVFTPGIEVKDLSISINGVDYFMSENRPSLKWVGPGHFIGKTIFPSSIDRPTRWMVTIIIHSLEGEILAPFEFLLSKQP